LEHDDHEQRDTFFVCMFVTADIVSPANTARLEVVDSLASIDYPMVACIKTNDDSVGDGKEYGCF